MARSIFALPPPVKAGSTRGRLLDAAALLFYENGFHAIGIDQIIDEVGVTKTTFYNHFESKDELIVAVLDDRDHRDMEVLEVEMLRRAPSPRGRIVALFDILDEWFRDADFRGCLFTNAAAQFPNPNDPIHVAAARHAQNVHHALATLAREAGAADPEGLARQLDMLITAAISARQVWSDTGAVLTARGMAEALLDRFLPRAEKGR